MKRLARVLLLSLSGLLAAILAVLAGGYLFLQTAQGRSWLEGALARALSTPTRKVAIRDLTGSPPFDIRAAALQAVDGREGLSAVFTDVHLVIEGRALLRGELAIRELRAASLVLRPAPVTAPPATSGLDLSPPRLPVDIALDDLTIETIRLEKGILDQAATLSLKAQARLVNGQAEIHAALRRTDGQPGKLALDVSLAGRPAVLDLTAEVEEPTGELADALLGRRDHAPLAVRLAGRGPVSDWHGQLQATLGALLEVHGSLAIAAAGPYRAAIQAEARQDGLLPAKLQPLIGPRLTLDAAVDYDEAGGVRLDRLRLAAAFGELSASGRLEARSKRLSGEARMSIPDLGLAGAMLGEKLAGRAGLGASFGGTLAEPSARLDLQGQHIVLAQLAADRLTASLDLALEHDGAGSLWQARGHGRLLGASRMDQPLPPGLGHDFDWSFAGGAREAERRVEIRTLTLAGDSLRLQGQGQWSPGGGNGSLSAEIAALDRFAGLARLPELSGRVRLDASFTAGPAGTGRIDFRVGSEALHTGVAAADALAGPRIALAGRLDRSADGRLMLSDLRLSGADLTASGNAETDAGFARPKGAFEVAVPRLADLAPALGTPLRGSMTLAATLDGAGALRLSLEGEELGTERILLRRLVAESRIPDLSHRAGRLSATAWLAGGPESTPLRLETGFAQPAPDRVALSDLSVTGAGTRIHGAIDYSTSTARASGRLTGSVTDLAPWSALAGLPLHGHGTIALTLTPERNQSAEAKVDLASLSAGRGQSALALDRIELAGRARELLKSPILQAELSVDHLRTRGLRLAAARAHIAMSAPDHADFAADAHGSYSPPAAGDRPSLPLTVGLGGTWSRSGRTQQVLLERVNASLAEDKAMLLGPLRLAFAQGALRLQDLAMSFAGGRLEGNLALESDTLRARLSARAVPLRPFARLAGQTATGTLDMTAELEGPAAAPSGQASLEGRDLRFAGTGGASAQLPPLDLNLTLAQQKDRIQLHGEILSRGSRLLRAAGTAPVRLSARPLSAAIPPEGELSLRVDGEGRLEKLAEVLPLGEDRLAGDYRIALAVEGTPARPEIGGSVAITKASYLNQAYGTELRNLEVELSGDRQSLRLASLSAGDGKSGTLQGSGQLDFAAPGSPALDFQVRLSRFLVANTDEARAEADAEIHAEGSLAAPRLNGRILLSRGEFRIPDQLPPSIPRLDVIEIDSRNPQAAVRRLAEARRRSAGPAALPIRLDIEVTVPGQSFVRGRGLDSEWRGKLHVTGTSAQPSIDGGLEIVRGTLSLLGKDFTIRRGTIRFPTGSPSDPWIDLLAEYAASDITAQITLTGSVTAPRLQLSSTPQLPQDQILARVLFGTDASHITTAEGLQLAFAARTLAGGGPGVLDRLRGALGLDRLDLGSGGTPGPYTQSSGSANNNGPTLSAGKYVAPGVFVGAEQGSSSGSTRAKVEVDLLPHVTGYSSVGANSGSRVGLEWRMDY